MNPSNKSQAQAVEAVIDAHDEIAGRPAAPPNPESVAAGFEVADARLGPIVRAFIALVIFSAVVLAVTTGFQALLTGRIDISMTEGGIAPPPNNEVPNDVESRAATGVESHELRATEIEQLSTYGWVDEGAGVTRIPIQRAMELLVERGLPTRADSTVDDLYQRPSDSSSGRMMERTVR